MSELKIDKELLSYLGGSSKFSDGELERQLVEEGGPRDPIYVWKGHNIIIDGHRRYTLCQKHGLPYETVEVSLKDKDAVRDWMDRVQFCRRNASHSDECRHVARLVAGKPADVPRSQAVAEVAAEVGITERQVYRDVAADEQHETDVAALVPAVREAIKARGEKLSKVALHSLATLEPKFQKHVASQVASGEFSSFREALMGEKRGKKKQATVSGKCPACAGTKWIETDDGIACEKCRHPYGEPAGDTDEERLKTQRQKTVKTIEALMRAFDDLQTMSAKPEHDEAVRSCKTLLKLAKGWK